MKHVTNVSNKGTEAMSEQGCMLPLVRKAFHYKLNSKGLPKAHQLQEDVMDSEELKVEAKMKEEVQESPNWR